MNKAGLIPTVIALLFLCFFSMFSSICLTETGKLVAGIRNNFERKFDYFHLIDTLVNDQIFLISSKFCVVINHLLYSILCIITLCKVLIIFFFQNYNMFSFIVDLMNRNNILLPKKDKIFLNKENPIIPENESIIIVLISFLLFLVFFTFNRFMKKIFVSIIFCLTILLTLILSINLTYFKKENKLYKIPLFGSDYTYVRIENKYISYMEQSFFLFLS